MSKLLDTDTFLKPNDVGKVMRWSDEDCRAIWVVKTVNDHEIVFYDCSNIRDIPFLHVGNGARFFDRYDDHVELSNVSGCRKNARLNSNVLDT